MNLPSPRRDAKVHQPYRELRGRPSHKGGAPLIGGMNKPKQQVRVGDVIHLMEQWAPAWTAEEWDRVGLVTGQPRALANKIWVALELTPSLLDQALARQVDMVLTHHPPLFKPLSDLRGDRPGAALLVRAAAAGLALFSAHTNLDAAPGGVNDVLAQRLGLKDPRPLAPLAGQGLAKLVVFVPAPHLEPVRQALFAAGCGRIGAYDECSFYQPGIGTYQAPAGGRPYQGGPGSRERVEEIRLETQLPLTRLGGALAALRGAHPYEEPAYDIYPLRQSPPGYGMGRVGELERPMPGHEFCVQAARALGSGSPQVCGPLPEQVNRVAVVGGSGGDLLPQAAAAGAQVLVTGEARYHAADQARDLGLALLILGHHATEALVVEPWARRLTEDLAAQGLATEIQPWTGPDPWRPVLLLEGG